MAIFASNQFNQFYVVKDATDAKVTNLDKTKEFYVTVPQYNRQGVQAKGVVHASTGDVEKDLLYRSDIIKKANILWAKKSVATDLQRKKNVIKVKVSSDYVVPGEDYIINVFIRQYIGASDNDTTVKFGAYRAKTNDKVADIVKGLAESLKKSLDREVYPLIKVEYSESDATITLTEVEQDWIMGYLPQSPVLFDVTASEITVDFEDTTAWLVDATQDTKEGPFSAKPEGDAIGNGKTVADMEYFYHGNRGDQLRDQLHPACPTYLVADPSQNYDIYQIHYSFIGEGNNVQKSEKDLTIAVPAGNTIEALDTIIAECSAYPKA